MSQIINQSESYVKSIIAIMLVTVSVSFGQTIPVFKVDYSTQDGTQLVLTNARVNSSAVSAPYLRGAWAVELERTTNGVDWQGVFTNTTDTLPATGVLEDVPPPSKNSLTDPMLGLLVNYRAKVAPCLSWKTVVSYHFRNGWNGFMPPFKNKYLKRTMQIEWLNVFGGVTNEVYGSPWTMVETLNRYTGVRSVVTGTPPDPQYSGWPFGGEATFPFSDPTVFTNPSWTISDTHYRLVEDSGPGDPRYIHYTDVWLSVPHTLAQTEGETQYLIDSSISNAPWGTCTAKWWGDCDPATCGDSGGGENLVWSALPAELWPSLRGINFQGVMTPNPCAYPVGTAAAAGSLYAPAYFVTTDTGTFFTGYDSPEPYIKWGTIVRSPWGWTVNSRCFTNSFNLPTLQGTQSVPTDCGGTINIQAPPPDVNTNWCITATAATGP